MELLWQVESQDVQRVREFVERHQSNPFVKERVRRNVEGAKPEITKETFWEGIVNCLLTTQQRSGPKSAVTRFINTRPFPLSYSACESQLGDLERVVKDRLTAFGGLRRTNIIAGELAANIKQLAPPTWEQTHEVLDALRCSDTVPSERNAAHFIAERYKGFGPKQSRNLLQSLGLTRYEIPIDSRITKWLNEFGFPLRVSATTLSDPDYYEMVMDGIQRLCTASHLYPCVLDAAIFVSFDGDGWTPENVIW